MEDMIKSILWVCNEGSIRRRECSEFRLRVRGTFQVARQIDADAGRLAPLVGHLEGGISQFHADDQLGMRLGGAPARRGKGK